MANTINMNLNLNTTGIKEANKDAAALADNLERANKATSTAGSRKAAGMGATPQARSRSENEEYNRGRGAMGVTGASARDFANQSQGLGGLVRLYATFAANLFAASAAFGALRQAANVTNMVKGLDQLGAASGRNLGSLAKNLVKVTDGAITLQEAMEATAKATAAGMSNENLKRLTTGAKNASQALGLNMSDALSRLTRGVTKLEPELLDELGIFVRVDTAAQKYAQSIGKATSQLTEFERRNAFAAEVLGQVESKFGALNLAANPYDKLLSSLKELAQVGLEAVNKVFGPIANFLSSSPKALGAVLVGITSLLLKQAIPAINQFRGSLMKAAEDAANISKAKAQDAISARASQLKKLEDMAEHWAENEVARVDAAQKKIQDIQQNNFKKSSASYKILSKTLQDISDKDLAVLDRNAKAAAKRGDMVSAKAYSEAAAGVREYRLAEEALAEQKKKNIATLEAESRANGTLGQNIRIAERADRAAKSAAITSNAAYIGSTEGVRSALANMHKEIKENGLTGFSRYKTYAVGAMAAVTGALSTFMNAFGIWIAVGTAAIAGITFLFEKLSATAEQSKKSAEDMDALGSAIDNVSRTMDVISRKDPLASLSVDTVQARANALNELANSMHSLRISVQKELEAMNGLDKFAENFKASFGYGITKGFNETFAKSIVKAFDASKRDPKLQQGIQDILGVPILSAKQLEAQLNKLPESIRQEKWEAIDRLVASLNLAKNNAASLSTSMIQSLDAVYKAQNDFINSFKPQDATFKLGASITEGSEAALKALSDTENSIEEIITLTKDPEKLRLFPPELAKEIASNDKALKNYASTMKHQEDVLATVNKRIAEQATALAEQEERLASYNRNGMNYSQNALDSTQEAKKIKQLKKEIQELTELATNVKIAIRVTPEDENAIKKLGDKIAAAFGQSFKTGISLMMASSDAEMAKAGMTFANGIAARLGDTETGIKMRADLAVRQNSLQIEILKASAAHILATENNTIALREATVIEKRKIANTLDGGARNKILTEVNLEESQIAKDKGALNNSGRGLTRTEIESLTKSTRDAYFAARSVQAQIIALSQSNQLIRFGEGQDKEKLQQSRNASDEQQIISLLKERVAGYNQLMSLNKEIDVNLLEQRQDTESLILSKERDLKLTEAKLKATQLIATLSAQNKQNTSSGKSDIAFANSQVNAVEEETKRLKIAQALTHAIELGKVTATNANLEIDKEVENRQMLYEEASKSLETDKLKLGYLKELGAVSESFYASQTYSLERQKELNESTLALQTAGSQFTKEYNVLLGTKEALQRKGADMTAEESSALAITESELTRISELYGTKVAQIISARNNTLSLLDKTSGIKSALLEQQEVMESMKDTTQALSDVFGEMGANIGKAGEAMLKLSQNSENRAKAEKELADAALTDPKKLEELTKLKSKNAKAELSDIAGVIGATKGLFKEKSKEYKAFAALEKAIHVANLIMTAKELAVKLGFYTAVPAAAVASETATTAATQAGAAARAPSYVAEIYARTIGQLGPIAGPAVAAGLIASLLGAITGGDDGGGGVSISNADIQKAQLTGQAYDANGNLVSISGGVFGDPSANVKGISDSIEKLGEVFFNGMSNRNSGILKHLRGIQENTGQTAAALINSSGNPNGIGPNISLPTGSASNLGDGLNAIPIIGNALAGIVNWFGGGGSKSYGGLDSQYLRLRGGNLADYTVPNMANPTGFYESNISIQHDKAWWEFSSSYKEYRQQIDKLDAGVLSSVRNIFTDFTASILTIGDALGDARERVIKEMSTISANIDFSVIGMSGTQISEALAAQLDKLMNTAVEKIWPWIKDFAKVGEEYSAVLIGLIKDSETISFGLDMVGKSIGTFATIQEKFATEKKFISNFGDIDAFADAIQNYYDIMFTDSEKLEFSFRNVQDRLADLGVAGVTTNNQLKALIQLTDPTTELYAELVKLVPVFNDVTEAMKAMESARDDLMMQIYNLTGDTAASTALSRQKTLADTDPKLQNLQKYVFALEDYKQAEKELNDARKKSISTTKKAADDQISTLKTTVSSLENFINSITNFKESLLVSDKSILTPLEKYQESKRQFDKILATAMGPATTAEEIKQRDNALNQIQSSATSFLDASRMYNASSNQYSTDFKTVQSALESTTGLLGTQKSEAQQTLDTLNAQSELMQSQLDAMEETAASTKSIAELEAALLVAQLKVNAASASATASGEEFTKTYADIVAASTLKVLAESSAEDKPMYVWTGSQISSAVADIVPVVQAALVQMNSSGGYEGVSGQESLVSAETTAAAIADVMTANPTISAIASAVFTVAKTGIVGFIAESLFPNFFNKVESVLNGTFGGYVSVSGGTTDRTGAGLAANSVAPDVATVLGATYNAINAYTSVQSTIADAIADIQSASVQTSMSVSTALDGTTTTTTTTTSTDPYGGTSSYSTTTTTDTSTGASSTSYGGGSYANGDVGYDGPDRGDYFAAGGYASGLSVVGELGPELVDFKTPGRVYTAEQTFGMFNGTNPANAAMLEEIRQLRIEVQKLREQQNKETGALINATYDVQKQASNNIAKAVNEAADKQVWQARTTQKVTLA